MDLHLSPIKSASSRFAANDEAGGLLAATAQAEALRSNDGRAHFDIYRTERVGLTSTLFGGGDWHWRLTSSSGAVLVDCGGYRNQAECLTAVQALRVEACYATISKRL